MKMKEVRFKKEDTIIPTWYFQCDCGGDLNDLGSAGCSHDDNMTYFYQCRVCKTVETSYRDVKTIDSFGDFERGKWVRLPDEAV